MSDIRVRVGQQNAIKITSSVNGVTVGFAAYSDYSGISSYSNLSGISSYSDYSGISSFSYYSDYSGISSYSDYSGISSFSYYSDYSGISGISSSAINISGGSTNNLIYQQSSGITTFVDAGTFGQVLFVDIDGKPRWISAPPATLVNGITVLNQDQIVGLPNSISTLRIVGSGLSASLGVTNSVANIQLIEVDGGEY